MPWAMASVWEGARCRWRASALSLERTSLCRLPWLASLPVCLLVVAATHISIPSALRSGGRIVADANTLTCFVFDNIKYVLTHSSIAVTVSVLKTFVFSSFVYISYLQFTFTNIN